MNTPMNEDRLQAIEAEEGQEKGQESEAVSLTELGKVSDTQGGIWGVKYDSAYGWQPY